MNMKSLAVYCGANTGNDPQIIEATKELARIMAKNDIRLVYGAGGVGLMGVVADEIIAHGGKTTGIIPTFLMNYEVHHKGLDELHIVETMHIRKAMMCDLSDGFVTLPGGYGTLDEIFEILCWRQLQLHRKPVGFLNVNGFYDHIFAHADHMVKTGFLRPENREFMILDSDPQTLLDKMAAFQSDSNTMKWITNP